MKNILRPLVATAALGTLVAAAACGGSSSGSTTPPPVANTVTITAGPGPSTASPLVNGAFVSVTICVPGSATQCTTVPNVLLDTGAACCPRRSPVCR
jgi:multidrug efflux pump subunit AcrA (membrane-fusion protein)